jgi:hypothetical protein
MHVILLLLVFNYVSFSSLNYPEEWFNLKTSTIPLRLPIQIRSDSSTVYMLLTT